jgi:hypothetical protein
MERVIIESPFCGNSAEEVARNISYGRACLADSIRRNEAPFASHLLYTQPGVLDDATQSDRTMGIQLGLWWGALADKTVVYTDLGVSDGMRYGIEVAEQADRPIEFRSLPSWGD